MRRHYLATGKGLAARPNATCGARGRAFRMPGEDRRMAVINDWGIGYQIHAGPLWGDYYMHGVKSAPARSHTMKRVRQRIYQIPG